jgi:hypothetical protein
MLGIFGESAITSLKKGEKSMGQPTVIAKAGGGYGYGQLWDYLNSGYLVDRYEEVQQDDGVRFIKFELSYFGHGRRWGYDT